MRLFLAGLILLCIPASVFAQARGEVVNIGFNGSYRPNCWTPMMVRLKPDSPESANYQLQVWQHDVDGDKPFYTRDIVLNGSGQSAEQLFWIYFLPQPIEKGLRDTNLHDLQKDVQVFLCTAGGKQQIAKLPLTSTLNNVDPYRDTYAGRPRGQKLILAVSASGANVPATGRYNDASGALEDVNFINIRMRDLPEDPIGYEAVDGIIWMDGNPADLSVGSQDTFSALKDYIRFGGHLVICQDTTDWKSIEQFGDLLPVNVQGVSTKTQLQPLESMGTGKVEDPFQTLSQAWGPAKGPFSMARATALPGTVVNNWIDWKQDGSFSDATPYLARKAYGLGQVTWVAQTLNMESLPGNATGWPHVWDKVFGWKSDSYILPTLPNVDNKDPRAEPILAPYEPAGPTDLGFSFTQGLNLDSKTAWLITLAVLFFLIYWVVAGPGTYAYLASKKKQGLSWFIFGAAALVGTGVTTLLVKIVLRGPPEIRHLTFIRIAPGQPAIAYSRFGLYIPRDEMADIQLSDTSPSSVSYLSPYAEHPQQLGGDADEFPSPAEYPVPVRDLKMDSAPALSVPYRSSLKKFQARWVGELPMKFIGTPKLDPTDTRLPISGSLTNASDVDLSDVFLAFNVGSDHDWVIYIPTWGKAVTYDLKKDLAKPYFVGRTEGGFEAIPESHKVISDDLEKVSDKIQGGWESFWFNHFRRGSDTEDINVTQDSYLYSYPMVSLFTRLPAMKDEKIPRGAFETVDKYKNNRNELYTRGARMLDASGSLTAGQLVILATSKGKIPIPLQVDGDKPAGDGTIFYQFILPIDRGKLDQPPAQPSTQPAPAPAAKPAAAK